jgi:acyl carrier protein
LAAGGGAARGFVPVSPEDGLRALAGLLASDATQAVVAPLDLRQWREVHLPVASSPMLARLAAPPSPTRGGAAALRARIAAADAGERQALVATAVREEVAAVLRQAPARIADDAPLRDLGVDSLRSLELRNRLEARFDVVLSATTLWSHGRVDALAGLISGRLEPAPVAAAPAGPQDDALAELDEDALAAALAAELASLRGEGGP